MPCKLTTVPVKPETRKAIKVMATEREINMYELVERLVEKGETILG